LALTERQTRMHKNPAVFIQPEDARLPAPYQPTFDFRGEYLNASHRFFAECPVDGILIQLRNRRWRGSVIEGWLSRDDALKLYELAYFVKGDILELGSFHGLSTSVLARANKDSPHKKQIYTVDLNPDNLRIAEENLRKQRLSKAVTAICGDAAQVVKQLASEGRRFEFVFIDHCHAYDPVYAVCLVLHQVVTPGAYCLFHDFTDPRNFDPDDQGHNVYQAVEDGLSPSRFEFCGTYGCTGLFQAR
jgi:cephalosporin hydroxylase